MLETEFRDIQRLFNARIVTGENSHTRQTVKEVSEYFAGTRRQFDLSVDALGVIFNNPSGASCGQFPMDRPHTIRPSHYG